jgi:hypothetical protein
MYEGLRQELDAFKHVPTVALMEDPPRHPAINPIDCLLRGGATLGSCTLTYPAELKTEHATIASIVAAHGDRYLKTKKWFCYDNKCPVVIGNTIAYWDTDHTTITYTRQIAPAVAADLKRLLATPSS